MLAGTPPPATQVAYTPQMRSILLCLALVLTACGSTAIPTQPRTTDPVIAVAPREKLGDVMTADGMTVYIYTKDPTRQTVCYDICSMNWPPLLVTRTPLLNHTFPGAFGSVTRTDGSKQLTYKGLPLYLYIEDPPGTDQANGADVDHEWFVVHP
jgi:predicted lipoprotein with Yx(FWY)xxD motif